MLVDCFCKKCNYYICRSLNSWKQFTDAGCVYKNVTLFKNKGLEFAPLPSGLLHGDDIKYCAIQRLICRGCQEHVGLKCEKTPQLNSVYWYVHFKNSWGRIYTVVVSSAADLQPEHSKPRSRIFCHVKLLSCCYAHHFHTLLRSSLYSILCSPFLFYHFSNSI